jgi:hypothetical protein
MAWFSRHRSGSQRPARTVVCGLMAVVATAAVYAQGNQLQLFVTATDASGSLVTDLKADEIAFAENGAPGKVVSLDPFNLPVKLTINIDNSSGSVNALGHYRTGLASMIEALPPEIETEVYTIAPQPRTVQRFTSNKEDLSRAITRFGPTSTDENARFTESIVEYAERLEKDNRDKKLNYQPVLVVLSTTLPEVSSVQLDTIERALKTLAGGGARVYMVMMTTRPGEQSQIDDLNNGRQAIIGLQLVKLTRGRYEGLADSRALVDLLPRWGKEIAEIHNRQTSQYRLVLERPGGASGPLNNIDLRITRPGLSGAVTGDGRFIPQ